MSQYVEEGTPALVGLSMYGLEAVVAIQEYTGLTRREAVEAALLAYAGMCRANERIAAGDKEPQMVWVGVQCWWSRKPGWWSRRRRSA